MSGKTKSLPTAEVDAARDMINHKPFRTQRQKEQARATAYKKNGTWYSKAEVSYHNKAGEHG